MENVTFEKFSWKAPKKDKKYDIYLEEKDEKSLLESILEGNSSVISIRIKARDTNQVRRNDDPWAIKAAIVYDKEKDLKKSLKRKNERSSTSFYSDSDLVQIENEISAYLKNDDSIIGWTLKPPKKDKNFEDSKIPHFMKYDIEIKYDSEKSEPDFPQIKISLKNKKEESNDSKSL